ncbi:hypothetical protein GCM10022261_23650 [Brevibacterium daeguense]|uniref:Uncharacterized protein n=1 Tax=Brevibacterium daeguense TaxID=909936 RepID=A0ABP8ELL4_9MICO|nr:hypothetical protein [Brevibacterium daeguense]
MEVRDDYPHTWTIKQWEDFMKKARDVGAPDDAQVYLMENDSEPHIAVHFKSE